MVRCTFRCNLSCYLNDVIHGIFSAGLNFSEKWNTSNILATEVSLQDLIKGAKFAAESTFAPQTGLESLINFSQDVELRFDLF